MNATAKTEIYAIYTCLGGTLNEQVNSSKYFETDKKYKVKSVKIEKNVTRIELEDFPGYWNSTLFNVDLTGFPVIYDYR